MNQITDGRDIDPRLAQLSGEAAGMENRGRNHTRSESEPWNRLPAADIQDPAYYDRPLLKEPVWKSTIPLYYFVGGAAGAALVMGAAAQLDRSGRLDRLMRRAHWAGLAGSAVSGLILINDLGRPSRFHHMLRVFRPTSPMNMGVWILTALSPSAAVAALFGNRRGLLGKLGDLSGLAAGVAGLALSTYTGVLLSNTAIPLWQESRGLLPILFGASAMASAGSIFDLAFEDPEARRVTYFFGNTGRVAELAAGIALERRAGRDVPEIANPLTLQPLWRMSTAFTAASLIVSLLPRQTRKKRVAAGALGIMGSLMMRYAIHHAGVASARDPRASFRQQRSIPPPSVGSQPGSAPV